MGTAGIETMVVMKVKKILVSQPQPANGKSPYYDIAERHGVEVVFRPFVKVEGVPVREFRQQKINPADFTAVIFTSRIAIENFFRLCEEMKVSVPDSMRYYCTSEMVALYLQKFITYRKRKVFFGKTGKLTDETLQSLMLKNNNEKYLIPISDVQTEESLGTDDLGLDITRAVMFRTVSNDFGADESFDYDVLLFFSPAGVHSLLKNFPDFNQDEAGIYIGTLGPATAKAVTDSGLRLDLSAPSANARSLPEALEAFLNDEESR